ncbi:MAG TPA: helix-turn-helix domain-containing protein [Mariniphaga anaerophila]|uniref:Helix-turn-helix domain-containing protein n=1 Tax=Mariniphaga anaerophila TaxID=1484053 RepID=A0A831PLX1_9BACT|nr:helix-turn-helix domain-containing protein [Mariniphaga anaerophila]
MHSFGTLIRELRKKEGYPLRKVAAFLDIDQAVLSKVERGIRRLNKEQVVKLARFFNYSEKELLVAYFSDLIIYQVGDEEFAKDALKVAEKKIDYQKFILLDRNLIIRKIINTLQQFPKVKNAWIYGSFSRKDDEPGSDIDLAVKTDETFSYFDLAEIQYQLENELQRKIDLGFIDAFKPHVFNNVEPDLKLIYER